MKLITPHDAYVQAMIVENPRMSEERFTGLLGSIRSSRIRSITAAWRTHEQGQPLDAFPPRIRKMLEAIEKWCAANTGRRGLTDDGRTYLIT